jgi:hypothetical protein
MGNEDSNAARPERPSPAVWTFFRAGAASLWDYQN